MNRVTVTSTLNGDEVVVGHASFSETHVVSTTFLYDAEYLARRRPYAIDPALPLDYSRHVVRDLPRAFQDASPDFWGRHLLQRQRDADKADGKAVSSRMTDVDYLLGAGDVARQGALRFSVDDGPFLHPSVVVPRTVQLEELLSAAETVAADDTTNSGWQAAVKLMLNAGTGALGGALPKAAVMDHGQLWLAKFPMSTDKFDRSVWEKTSLDLAELAGIPVPERDLVRVGPKTILLVKRFDRDGDERVPYVSARTLMQAVDGVHHDYRDMADALREYGSSANEDLAGLYRQVALGAMIHNTDNHLRNHGFLRDGAGWRLAPAFDVNPNPETGAYRTVSAGGSSLPYNTANGLLALAPHCRLNKAQALEVLDEVATVVETWRDVAEANGATPKEIAKFTDAFTVTTTNLREALSSATRPRTSSQIGQTQADQGRTTKGEYDYKLHGRPDRGLE